MDLSVVIPALHEADNLAKLLPRLHEVLSGLNDQGLSAGEKAELGRSNAEAHPSDTGRALTYEILVVDNHSPDETCSVCEEKGAIVLQQDALGYGGALWAGFAHAKGDYILTMDADLSHLPDFIPEMWKQRKNAELVIASRYVKGGKADMPWYRYVLSIILNQVYTRLLSLPVRDISSGFRLYHVSILRGLELRSADFDALEEILIKCYAKGCRILEIPFRYVPRDEGKSKVKLLQFGLSYLRTLLRMWRLRNSIASADYDARAYDSPIFLQRYWQRRRYDIVMKMIRPNLPCLDIGCGSSRILGALPSHSIGLDINNAKLLYSRRYGCPLVAGSAFALPVPDESFDQLLCSQVIEHLVQGTQPFQEMARVLRPNGHLVLGTPDYGRLNWLVIESLYRRFAPDAYGDEHITHYTRGELLEILSGYGFEVRDTRYICGGEMILSLVKVRSA